MALPSLSVSAGLRISACLCSRLSGVTVVLYIGICNACLMDAWQAGCWRCLGCVASVVFMVRRVSHGRVHCCRSLLCRVGIASGAWCFEFLMAVVSRRLSVVLAGGARFLEWLSSSAALSKARGIIRIGLFGFGSDAVCTRPRLWY